MKTILSTIKRYRFLLLVGALFCTGASPGSCTFPGPDAIIILGDTYNDTIAISETYVDDEGNVFTGDFLGVDINFDDGSSVSIPTSDLLVPYSHFYTEVGTYNIQISSFFDGGGPDDPWEDIADVTVTVITREDAIQMLKDQVAALVSAGKITPRTATSLTLQLDRALLKVKSAPLAAATLIKAFIAYLKQLVTMGALAQADAAPLLAFANQLALNLPKPLPVQEVQEPE